MSIEVARLHEHTDEMDDALEIDEAAAKLEHGEIEGRAVTIP